MFIVTLVVVIVSAGLPQLDVEHVGSDHLRVTAAVVLALDQIHELVVDASAVREEERGAGRPESGKREAGGATSGEWKRKRGAAECCC